MVRTPLVSAPPYGRQSRAFSARAQEPLPGKQADPSAVFPFPVRQLPEPIRY